MHSHSPLSHLICPRFSFSQKDSDEKRTNNIVKLLILNALNFSAEVEFFLLEIFMNAKIQIEPKARGSGVQHDKRQIAAN